MLAAFYIYMMGYLEQKYYTEGLVTPHTDIIMSAGLAYIILGTYLYIPGLICLNLFSFFASKQP